MRFVGGIGGVRGRHYILMLPALLAVYHKSQNKGLTSVNRDKPTLALTVPRSIKVVYRGFIVLSARNAIEYGVGLEAYGYA